MLQPYIESDTKLSDKKKYLQIVVTDILQNNGSNCGYSVNTFWLNNFSNPIHFYHQFEQIYFLKSKTLYCISNDFKSDGERRRAFQLGAYLRHLNRV